MDKTLTGQRASLIEAVQLGYKSKHPPVPVPLFLVSMNVGHVHLYSPL